MVMKELRVYTCKIDVDRVNGRNGELAWRIPYSHIHSH
jgi:hypothetical protein